MRKTITYIMFLLAAAITLASCGQGRAVSTANKQQHTAAVTLPPLSHNDSLRFKMYYYEAVRQHIAGNFDAAYDLLRHSLTINPNAAEVYFMISSYNGMLKGDSAALADIKKAAELNPDNNTYLERLGAIYLRMNDMAAATPVYEKLSHNSPERSDVLNILTQLYGRQKDYANTIKTIERIEELEGSSEQTALAKMHVYSLQGKKEEELNVLKSLSEQHPNDLNYRVMTGNWLLQNGKADEAYREYTEVLKQEPDNSMAQMSMIDYYKATGSTALADSIRDVMLISQKTDSESKVSLMRQVISENEDKGGDSTKVLSLFAKILAEKQETSDMAEMKAAYMTLKNMPADSINNAVKLVLDINPENTAARFQLIQAHLNSGDYSGATELARQGLEYSPDEMAFYYLIGMSYMQESDDDKALDAFSHAVRIADDKDNPSIVSDCYTIMGDILHERGLDEEAYAAYDSSLQWNADNYYCLNNYAYFLALSGEHLDKAEQMSYRTVQNDPHNANNLDTYAWVLFKRKKYAEAKEYIDQAVQNDTLQTATVLEHAGDIYYMNGDKAGALDYWQKALKKSDKENITLTRKIKLRKYVEDK